MSNRRFGYGIIGAGVIANFHAKAVAAIANADLVGVYNINPAKAVVFAETHSCTAYESLENMLANPAIHIVCICTPSGMHLEPALQCIAAGKHCLVEKPLEVTVDRCDQIIEAARMAGVLVGVIFPSRFYEANRQLKQAIVEQRFGDLVLGSAYVKWSRSADYYRSAKWRGTWAFDGGGALMNQGIHSVDLLQWFMGPVVSVHAVSANRRHQQIEVEDTVVATVTFASGALGTIECSTAVYPGSLKRIEVLGTTATVVIEENDLVKWQFEQQGPSDELIRDRQPGSSTAGGASDPVAIGFYGHQKQMEDMMHAIETGTSPMIDAVEGRKSVEIVVAIYQSAKTGETVWLSH